MMKAGKVPGEILKRLVYPHLGRRNDVLLHAHLGEDCAAIAFGEWTAVVTTDPITGTQRHLGRFAVHVACNDLATTGAEPVALLLTLLLRDGASTQELETIMQEAGAAASILGVEIVGGHTEVTAGLMQTIAVMMAIGRAHTGKLISARGGAPGQTLILTKGAGIEGTAILATDLADYLKDKLGHQLGARAQDIIQRISVVPEGRIAARAGAAAMHDVTEGGVLAGAWEIAEASDCGVELWADQVPILTETASICGAFAVDPLALIGSGAMLIATTGPTETLGALSKAGIHAAAIGILTAHERTIIRSNSRTPLVPPDRDELWRILERFKPAP
jgi:hydrogenase maturation factor